MSITKKGRNIDTLRDWETLAGPKSTNQWVDGRSAKETARAWLEGGGESLPAEILDTITTNPAFGRIDTWHAEPEARLRFDRFPGEPRNSDLAVYAEDARGPYIIAVEAKADEPFGNTVADTMAAALERYLENLRSNGLERIKQLASAILGERQRDDPQLGSLRYQLLTASAGALCEAERCGCARAVLLVHEFITDRTSDPEHERNQSDLNAFVKRLSHGSVRTIRSGELLGPFFVPGVPLLSVEIAFFIGKASRNIRQHRGSA